MRHAIGPISPEIRKMFDKQGVHSAIETTDFPEPRDATAVGPGRDTEIVDQAIAFWAQHATRPSSCEDARQIQENLIGFFGLLAEWDAAEKTSGNCTGVDNTCAA